MAGTVGVANFYQPENYEVLGGTGTGKLTGPKSKKSMSMRNMEENDVLNYLNDESFDKRAEILEQLRTLVRRNGGRLPFANRRAIFCGLALALSDNSWDVRHQCIQLIHEVMPGFGDELDSCMDPVLPKLVRNMGDTKMTIRRAAIQTLHVYMKRTYEIDRLFRAIVRHGLEVSDQKIKKEVIVSLPMLFTPEFSQENFGEIARSLVKRLCDTSDDHLQQHVLLSLEKIRELVGEQTFNSYLQKLSPPMRALYFKTQDVERTPASRSLQYQNSKNSSWTGTGSAGQTVGSTRQGQYSQQKASKSDHITMGPNASRYFPGSEHCEFGVVPSHVMGRLNDQSDFRTRAQAVEELKVIIKDLHEISLLAPHTLQFISFLNNLLDDSHFKITTVTLEILGLLVDKFQKNLEPHLRPFVSALTKRMGDNKMVIRQVIHKVVMQLMQNLGAKEVLDVICENLSHRNSRVRVECLNIIIASLLTFPSYSFDLGTVCQTIAPTLVDPKRQVRQACLECFAVVASDLGAGKLHPLVQAVDSVELCFEGDGAMSAVQARLARRQLPRLNSEGLVDYATPIPSSATLRGSSSPGVGADIEWILSVAPSTGGSASSRGSARGTARSEVMELESVTSSARSTPANFLQDLPPSGPSTPRRTLSAKKSRLPWEQDSPDNLQQNGDLHSDRQGKGRTTWAEEKKRHDTVRSSQHKNASSPSVEDPPDPNSYRGIYASKSKYKRQSSDAPSQPFSVYSPTDDGKNADVRKSFSNSWPDTKLFEEAGLPHRRRLDPISAPETPTSPPDWADEGMGYDTSPIPMKPTLVGRVSSSRNKVPPIPVSQRSNRDDYYDSARDSALDGMMQDESRDEMDSSLRQLRNSAKKKVEKMFNQRSQRTPSPPSSRADTFDESGIFSHMSTMDETDFSAPRRKEKKSESPFESKPRIPRKGSFTSPKSEIASDSHSSFHNLDYQPHGGVTFSKNRASDVSIVGRGYAEDAHPVDPRPSQQVSKAREQRRKAQKASVLSPLGMANPHATGAAEIDDDKVPGGVIGKGVFDSGHPSEQSMTYIGSDRSTRRQSQTDTRNLPSGVYGIGVKQNSLDKSGDDEDYNSDDYDEDDDVSSMSMSETTRKNLALRQRQKVEEVEQRRRQEERERRQRDQEERRRRQEEDEELKREKQRQQEKLRQLSSADESGFEGLAISGKHSTTPNQFSQLSGGRPPRQPVPKKRNKIPYEDKSPISSTPSPNNESDNRDTQEELLKPLRDPNSALNDAMKNIANSQWEVKCSAINVLRRLVQFHPEVLCGPHLHTIILALMQEVKNLRSQVSRLAIVALGDMYVNLRKNMEPDLDQTTKVLLAKNGESNGFIREDVEKSLLAMVENVTPQRAMVALIAGGASHKNQAVRKTSSQFLVAVVERMGPGRVLSGVKDVTDKILPVAAQFVQDNSPETRYNGQRILYTLMSHEDFDKMMNKHVTSTTMRNIQDKLDSLKRKGLGDPPTSTPSARGGRSGQGSRSGSSTRHNSASSSEPLSAPSSAPNSSKRRSGQPRTDEATLETIKAMAALMGGADWRDRQKGIQQFQEMTEASPHVVGNNIVKIFDKFSQCLKDSNSKVNLQALQTMQYLAPLLRDYIGSILTISVQNVTVNLSSKNKDIFEAASGCLDAFMEQLDGAMLIQPFANQVTSGNARTKPDMIERLAYLVQTVYPRKSKPVVLHVLPLLWTLLGSAPSSGATPGASGAMRRAVTNLVSSLYSQMGSALLDQASSNSSVTPRMQQTLQDMVENP